MVLSTFELNRLLQLCSKSKSLRQGKQTHQQIIVHGLTQNPFTITKLIQFYADCDDIVSSHQLFDKLSQPNVFAWTSLLGFYTRTGMPRKCITAYCRMKLSGVLPDRYVFPKVIKACAQLFCLEAGVQVHKDVITSGDELNVEVCNSLIDMYSKCGNVASARRVFDVMLERDLLSWNSLISGYVNNGFLPLAVDLLSLMRLEGFGPDVVTWNTIMDAYCRMGECDKALDVLREIKEPSVISWTTLISGYSRTGEHEMALRVFRDMMYEGGVFADADCLSSVLVSCRHIDKLRYGQEIHGYGIKTETDFAFYKSAGPALLTMYARFRRTNDAMCIFKMMDKSDVVTWNAMILGFSDLGMGNSALKCFREMQNGGIENDQTTVSTVLPVCDLRSGKQIHAYIRKSSLSCVTSVWNALIHMYSKCGSIQTAYRVFSNMESKDVVSWNTIIGGFGMHGFGKAALELLQEMRGFGLSPNSITFTSVLSACSHSGLVDEGLELFHRMSRDFGFSPGMEHYSCVVDLFARASRLEDAVEFIRTIPTKPDKRIWGALLAASQTQQNFSTGILASENLVQLEPENAGHYVALSNMYARAGQWDDAVRVRKIMESKGLVKPSGNSWIGSGN